MMKSAIGHVECGHTESQKLLYIWFYALKLGLSSTFISTCILPYRIISGKGA